MKNSIVKMQIKNMVAEVESIPELQHVFVLWPNLLQITKRFYYFVSPLMPAANGQRLVDYASIKALSAYENEEEDSEKPRAFVHALLVSAIDSFDGVEIQGFNEHHLKTWEPYIEPVSSWIEREKIYAITTSTSDIKDKSLVMKSLVAHILTATDFNDYLK